MKNKNQIVCDRIDAWDLPEDVRRVIDSTDYTLMDELFGGIGTAEELIAFVMECGLLED